MRRVISMRINDLSLEQQKLIDPCDRQKLGLNEPVPQERQSEKRPRLERDEQRVFANWLLLNNLPHCWHATHRRSTATKGVSDFWVGKNGKSIWLEFKSFPVRISVEQVAFQELLSKESILWAVVLSADEAIQVVKKL